MADRFSCTVPLNSFLLLADKTGPELAIPVKRWAITCGAALASSASWMAAIEAVEGLRDGMCWGSWRNEGARTLLHGRRAPVRSLLPLWAGAAQI